MTMRLLSPSNRTLTGLVSVPLMALTIAAEKDEPEVHLSDPFPVPACSACFESAATGVVGLDRV